MCASGEEVGGKSACVFGQVSVGQEANWSALRVSGEHDLSTVELFDAAFAEIMLTDTVDVRVDLSDVTLIDCSTVAKLVHGRSLLASCNQVLTIRGAAARQRWFLDLTARAVAGSTPPVQSSSVSNSTTATCE